MTHISNAETEESLKSIFKKGKRIKPDKLFKPLVALRGKKCEVCGIMSWHDNTHIFQIHHINGDRTDNSLENLQLLCCNCHAATPNHSRKKCSDRVKVSDKAFVAALKKSYSIGGALDILGLSSSAYARAYRLVEKYDVVHLRDREHSYTLNMPPKEKFISDLLSCSLRAIAKKYKVPKSRILLWQRLYKLPKSVVEIRKEYGKRKCSCITIN